MPYQYQSVSPVCIGLVPSEAQMVATTRPTCNAVGPCNPDELDDMAACALNAGHDVWMVAIPHRLYDDVVDLYVL